MLVYAKRSGKSRGYTWFNSHILSCSWFSCQSSEKSFTCKFTWRQRSFSSFITGLECVRHFLLFLWLGSHHEGYVSLLLPDRDYPPKYKKLRKWIHDLPQYNLSFPFSEGKYGRYVKFLCQVHQLGWKNLLNKVRSFLFFLFSYWEGYSISDQLLNVDE